MPCWDVDYWLRQSLGWLGSALGHVYSNSQWYKLLKGIERNKQVVYIVNLGVNPEDEGWWGLTLGIRSCPSYPRVGPCATILQNTSWGDNPFISLMVPDLSTKGHWRRLVEYTWDWNLKPSNRMCSMSAHYVRLEIPLNLRPGGTTNISYSDFLLYICQRNFT